MRHYILGAVICSAIVLGSGKARADPLPVAILGAWSPAPGCPATAPRVTLAAHQLTVYEGNGVTDVVMIEASGKLADKLRIRVTALPAGTRTDSEGPHVGDIIFFKLDDKGLNMVGPLKAGEVNTPSPAMLLMRCK